MNRNPNRAGPFSTGLPRHLLIAGTVGFFAVLISFELLFFNPGLNVFVGNDYSIDKVYVTDGRIVVFEPFFYGQLAVPATRPQPYVRNRPSFGVQVRIAYRDRENILRHFDERWMITTIDEYKVGDTVPVFGMRFDNRTKSIYAQESNLRFVLAKYVDQTTEESLPQSEQKKLHRLRRELNQHRRTLARAAGLRRAYRKREVTADNWATERADWEAANPNRIPTNVLLARGEFAPGGKYAVRPKKD